MQTRDRARYVSVGKFAELVSLSERTCWSLIQGDLIPAYRVRRRTLIKAEEGFEALERLAHSRAGVEPTDGHSNSSEGR